MSATGARRAFLILAAVFATALGGILVVRSPLAHGSAAAPPTAVSSPSHADSPTPSPTPTPTPTPRPSPSVSPSPSPSPTASKDDAALTQTLDSTLAAAPGHAAVAVVDLDSGASLSRGDTGHLFVTASIVKADILVGLLLHHQDTGTSLTAGQRSLATRMIEESDNDAATSLLAQLGGADALDAVNARLGLHHTTVGADGYWGLTTTTAADQLTLLRQIFGGRGSKLSAASRTYVRSLMGEVEADQDWGVSAAAAGGYAVKNGWLPRSATGLWVINSIGWVERHEHGYLVAVLSDGNPSMADGISLVERVAQAAVRRVAGP